MLIEATIKFAETTFANTTSNSQVSCKIPNIKALRRAVPGLGLKEAKEFVERAMFEDIYGYHNGVAVLLTAAQYGMLEAICEVDERARYAVTVVSIRDNSGITDFTQVA